MAGQCLASLLKEGLVPLSNDDLVPRLKVGLGSQLTESDGLESPQSHGLGLLHLTSAVRLLETL